MLQKDKMNKKPFQNLQGEDYLNNISKASAYIRENIAPRIKY
jgi:hypothetical protein